jgi:polyphosphate glucokinase
MRMVAESADLVSRRVLPRAGNPGVAAGRHARESGGVNPSTIVADRVTASKTSPRKVLVVDVGGTSVKVLATGQDEPRRFLSGRQMKPEQMVSGVKKIVRDWKYDVVSIGNPGLVLRGRPDKEPHNIAPAWVGFDFKSAFGCPVKIVNDAAMQALGSYKGGLLLFMGLGTGLGSALVHHGLLVPMELAHLSYRKGTYEDYVGLRGLKRLGKKKWQRHVEYCVARLIDVLHPDDVVLGGGNTKKLNELPPACRAGDNANAFLGGFRLWDDSDHDSFRFEQVNGERMSHGVRETSWVPR